MDFVELNGELPCMIAEAALSATVLGEVA